MAKLARSINAVSQLPFRPRFIKELAVVESPSGVTIHGGVAPRFIETGSNKTSLLYLFTLLDGTRSISELEAALPGVPTDDIINALTLLNQLGLLEENDLGLDINQASAVETLNYLRRFRYVYGKTRSGLEAFELIRNTTIVLVCSERDSVGSQLLQDTLSESGFTCIHKPIGDVEKLDMGISKNIFVVSLSLKGFDHKWHRCVHLKCRARGLAWLRIVIDSYANFADIGPRFGSSAACYDCFEAMNGSGESSGNPSCLSEIATIVALSATEIVHTISRLKPGRTDKGFIRYKLRPHDLLTMQTTCLPGCSERQTFTDRTITEPHSLAKCSLDVSTLYEQLVRGSIRIDSGQPSGKDVTTDSALEREFKTFPHSPRVELPRLDNSTDQRSPLALIQVPSRDQALSLKVLAELCELSAGIRNMNTSHAKIQRWAPTAGNLGSVELYLIVLKARDLDNGENRKSSKQRST